MKKSIYKHIIYFFLGFFTVKSLAQQGPEMTIKGTVVESNGGQPVAFATVMIADIETNTAITGTTTLEDGSFEITFRGSEFFVEVSFIGFQSKSFKNLTPENGVINLGIIVLQEDAQQLEEVIVEGEISKMEFKLDKKVFNVPNLTGPGFQAQYRSAPFSRHR